MSTFPIGHKPNGTPYTVFLIDDSLTAREILKRILLSLQFKIIDEADNGEIAINKITASKMAPDFIFIDMEMPLMDGIETIKRIKPILQSSRIIMVTAHGEKEMVTELLKLGVNGYIKKPYDRDTVVKRVAGIVGRPFQE
ncbi:MAG TPA: response regulator [Spirochaetota bacterium]|nr:response regulator [Spirochaetota bacterium]HPC41132.1 response regulator [Spirochaetota bacterium]HPL15554.1 response regulator [Spirochaetota bacterium]HQF07052.1 response regulator [Spirochaetota bacterium]HQH95789.1 response regulator [Spirochaetota bacterium]